MYSWHNKYKSFIQYLVNIDKMQPLLFLYGIKSILWTGFLLKISLSYVFWSIKFYNFFTKFPIVLSVNFNSSRHLFAKVILYKLINFFYWAAMRHFFQIYLLKMLSGIFSRKGCDMKAYFFYRRQSKTWNKKLFYTSF